MCFTMERKLETLSVQSTMSLIVLQQVVKTFVVKRESVLVDNVSVSQVIREKIALLKIVMVILMMDNVSPNVH